MATRRGPQWAGYGAGLGAGFAPGHARRRQGLRYAGLHRRVPRAQEPVAVSKKRLAGPAEDCGVTSADVIFVASHEEHRFHEHYTRPRAAGARALDDTAITFVRCLLFSLGKICR